MAYGTDVTVYLEDTAGDLGAPGSPAPWWLSPDVDIPAHAGEAVQGVNDVQVRVHAHDVPVLAVEAQVFHQIAQEFPGIALCLEQEGAVDVALPSLEQLEEQSGLSHPGLSYKREKSTAGLNSVEQRRQRLSVGRAEIQEPRIRSYTEGLFAQSVKIKKHRLVAILGDCCNHWTSQKTFYFFWCTE